MWYRKVYLLNSEYTCGINSINPIIIKVEEQPSWTSKCYWLFFRYWCFHCELYLRYLKYLIQKNCFWRYMWFWIRKTLMNYTHRFCGTKSIPTECMISWIKCCMNVIILKWTNFSWEFYSCWFEITFFHHIWPKNMCWFGGIVNIFHHWQNFLQSL